jgi:cytochrome bd-type quinol oxidase subunit 1
MGPSGLIAILAGWFTTEIGRQPWVVYGLMRTADASSNHSVMQMSITLILFVVVYFALFGAGLRLHDAPGAQRAEDRRRQETPTVVPARNARRRVRCPRPTIRHATTHSLTKEI